MNRKLFSKAEPLEPQIASLLDVIDLSVEDWHISRIVMKPGYAPAAFVLLTELHGRMGHFPAFVRLRPMSGPVPTYEVAELLNLQAVRESARKRR